MNYDISIIIPCLNEEQNAEHLVARINEYLRTLTPLRCEVIFVDDGSTDGTFQKLYKAPHKAYAAKIIRFSRNFGSHAALYAGIRAARGLYTTYLAADLQYPLEVVGPLYRKCLEGYDLVRLERESSRDPALKRFLSKGYAALMRAFVTPDYPANGFDIVMFHQKVRDEINDHAEANSSILLRILSLGFKHASISSEKKERLHGRSKWTLRKNVKLLVDSFISFSHMPVRCISLVGLGFLLFGIFYSLWNMGSGGLTLERVTIVILLVGLGLTNLSIGIIGEYLWRTYEVVRHKKVYIIDSVVELN